MINLPKLIELPKIEANDGLDSSLFILNRPNQALYIPPRIWASEINFTSGAICLVLASHVYEGNDYLRDYKEFLSYKNDT